MIKIDFEKIHPVYGSYKDAIILPDDHGLSDAEIQAMQDQRFNSWVNYVENPPPAPTTVRKLRVDEKGAPVLDENGNAIFDLVDQQVGA